jgi:hypothetical protein
MKTAAVASTATMVLEIDQTMARAIGVLEVAPEAGDLDEVNREPSVRPAPLRASSQ